MVGEGEVKRDDSKLDKIEKSSFMLLANRVLVLN